MRKLYRNEQGFTLIELMIVIIILGILAVLGIPRLMNSKRQAWGGACLANRASLEDAGERFQFDTNGWPGNQAALLATTGNGPYIKDAYLCPASNTSGVYTFASATQTVGCQNIDTAATTISGLAVGKHLPK